MNNFLMEWIKQDRARTVKSPLIVFNFFSEMFYHTLEPSIDGSTANLSSQKHDYFRIIEVIHLQFVPKLCLICEFSFNVQFLNWMSHYCMYSFKGDSLLFFEFLTLQI